MPIGWLYGLSLALLITGGFQAAANMSRRPFQSEAVQIERTRQSNQGRLYMYIGLLTLIGTLAEQWF